MNRKAIQPIDCSTRRKRRAVLASSLRLLEQISAGEAVYRDNMPPNLMTSNAYDMADYYVSLLEEAIDVLHSVYDD
jgi:hypothetical protein